MVMLFVFAQDQSTEKCYATYQGNTLDQGSQRSEATKDSNTGMKSNRKDEAIIDSIIMIYKFVRTNVKPIN